jgi:hypothetical protein
MRAALSSAAIFFRESKEFRALESHIVGQLQQHLRSFLPAARPDADFEIEFFLTTVSAVAERVTSQHREEATLTKWASAVSEMLCDQLKI